MRLGIAAEDAWLRFRRVVTRAAVREKGRAIFGWLPGGLALARRLVRSDLALIAPMLDRDFYLSQLTSPAERRQAARDAALHYRLVGQRFERWPRADFDPRAWRFAAPDLKRRHDVFARALRHGWRAPALIAAGEAPPTILTLDHGRGGGSTLCLDLYEGMMRAGAFPLATTATQRRGDGAEPASARRVIRLARVPGPAPLLVARDEHGHVLFHGDLLADADALTAFARRERVERLVVNHLIDLPRAAFADIPALARTLAIPYDVIAHDYFFACPRVNLLDAQNRYCGLAPVETCRICLASGGTDAGVDGVDPAAWRATSADFLAGAEQVITPSADLAARLATAFPRARFTIVDPPEAARPPPTRAPTPPAPEETIRVVVIGAISVPKGYFVLHRLAGAIRRRKLPIAITVLGRAPWPANLRVAGVTVHGRYREEELDAMLDRLAPHLAFFPAIWPETWSFTLSIALARGLPIAAFDLGAIAARLASRGLPRLDPALQDNADALADALLAAARGGTAARGGAAPAQPASFSAT